MNVLKFDESGLVLDLSKLSRRFVVAFALCCATRQLSAFEIYAEKFAPEVREIPPCIVDELWDFVGSNKEDTLPWVERLAAVEALFPEEQDSWAPLHVYAENALYSLAYTIRCLIAADAQEAAYAARVAYEAADQAALRFLDDSRGSPDIEWLVLSSDIVQRELQRQADDLGALKENAQGVIVRLKGMASSSQLLTMGEILV
jgi:hypothetical protein